MKYIPEFYIFYSLCNLQLEREFQDCWTQVKEPNCIVHCQPTSNKKNIKSCTIFYYDGCSKFKICLTNRNDCLFDKLNECLRIRCSSSRHSGHSRHSRHSRHRKSLLSKLQIIFCSLSKSEYFAYSETQYVLPHAESKDQKLIDFFCIGVVSYITLVCLSSKKKFWEALPFCVSTSVNLSDPHLFTQNTYLGIGGLLYAIYNTNTQWRYLSLLSISFINCWSNNFPIGPYRVDTRTDIELLSSYTRYMVDYIDSYLQRQQDYEIKCSSIEECIKQRLDDYFTQCCLQYKQHQNDYISDSDKQHDFCEEMKQYIDTQIKEKLANYTSEPKPETSYPIINPPNNCHNRRACNPIENSIIYPPKEHNFHLMIKRLFTQNQDN